jgi:hypothetical protein
MANGEQGRPSAPRGLHKGDAARAERLRLALRENLKRRKLQAKGRATDETKTGAAHDSAGIVPEKSKG